MRNNCVRANDTEASGSARICGYDKVSTSSMHPVDGSRPDSDIQTPPYPSCSRVTRPNESIMNDAASDKSSLTWIARLTAADRTRDDAIAELRIYLVRGLTKAMSTRYGGGYSAEDAVQESLVKILDSLDQFSGRSRFTTWAMTVAIRVSISEMRRKHYQDVSIESFRNEDARIEPAVTEPQDPGQAMDRRSLMKTLQQLIDETLTEKQRFAVRASLEGLPVEVIARKSGSNRNSVYKLVHDARLKLRRGLEANDVSVETLEQMFG